MRSPTFLKRLLVLACSLGLLLGCKSKPRVDWDARIGTFTYDQAVAELGPPDKTATLSNGQRVADWIQPRRGGGVSFGIGTGFSSGGVGVGAGHTVGGSQRYETLRLTFDTDNKLVSWTRTR